MARRASRSRPAATAAAGSPTPRRTARTGIARRPGPCQCGVYGAAGPERARQYFVASWAELEGLPPPPLADDYVPRAVGQVQLWGRVLECAQGYRAEHGYPSRIWIPARRPDGRAFDVESIALDLLDYGVAVELLDVATRAEISERLPSEQAA